MTQPIRLSDANREPDPDVIHALERLLEEARSGELRGVFILTNYADCMSRRAVGQWSERDAVFACEFWKKRVLEESEE
jgi:hypothetical protein